MKTLKLIGGDFEIGASGETTMAKGVDRLAQDLRCWLLEPFGSDPINPGFGSTIPELVGEALTTGSIAGIESEVNRVLGNYVAYQTQTISLVPDGISFMSRYEPSELIASIDSVKAKVDKDSVSIRVAITTMANQTVEIAQVF